MSTALARAVSKGLGKGGTETRPTHAQLGFSPTSCPAKPYIQVILWLPACCFINPLPPIPTHLGQYLQVYSISPLRLAC